MEYIKGLADYKASKDSVVTFGKFDGLHIGHHKLIDCVKEMANKQGLASIVCAFDMHMTEALMTKEERKELLEGHVDYLVDCPFTKAFSQMRAEEFIEKVVKELFRAKAIVVGTDFCFGYKKQGDVNLLKKYEKTYDYKLIVIEKERYNDKIVSSTYIRDVVKQGDMDLADHLLGYSYGVEGMVEHGKQLGRTLGFPTMNVAWPEGKMVPPTGVYMSRVWIDEQNYPAITNVGVKPTVTDENRVLAESYLFEYKGNAYGEHVCIELLELTRPEQKFSGKEELKAQVDTDIAKGKQYFGLDE